MCGMILVYKKHLKLKLNKVLAKWCFLIVEVYIMRRKKKVEEELSILIGNQFWVHKNTQT